MSVLPLEDHPLQPSDAPNTSCPRTVIACPKISYVRPGNARTICDQVAVGFWDRFCTTHKLVVKNKTTANKLKEGKGGPTLDEGMA